MNNKHKFTSEGLENIKERLSVLKEIERPRVVEALKEARAQGDLSENAEYDAARDEQARIEQEITELEEILKNAIIIEDAHTSNVGKLITVSMKYKNPAFPDEVHTFLLVSSSLEANPREDKISIESALGKVLHDNQIGYSCVMMEGKEYEYTLLIENIESK